MQNRGIYYYSLTFRKSFKSNILVLCLLSIIIITINCQGNEGGEESVSLSASSARFINSHSYSLKVCARNKNRLSISVVGIDYLDRITFVIRTHEGAYYSYTCPKYSFEDFPLKFDEDALSNVFDAQMTAMGTVEDFKKRFNEIEKKFGKIMGSQRILLQQNFYYLLTNCNFDICNEGKATRASMLQYLDPNRMLVTNFSDNLPEDTIEYRIYDIESGKSLDKTLVQNEMYKIAMQSSLPFGESGEYVILSERSLGTPVFFGIRLLQISPLKSIKEVVFPYENAYVTALSKPKNKAEIKISLSDYPYMVTCRLLTGSTGASDIEMLEDCTPPVSPSCPYASDFQYADPWITWITNENSYVLHFWNSELGWYMVDLAPYTKFDSQIFPKYYFSATSSTILLYQSKRNQPVFFIKPDLPG